jgi:hypothetical protein
MSKTDTLSSALDAARNKGSDRGKHPAADLVEEAIKTMRSPEFMGAMAVLGAIEGFFAEEEPGRSFVANVLSVNYGNQRMLEERLKNLKAEAEKA